jgi:hypothetical protein
MAQATFNLFSPPLELHIMAAIHLLVVCLCAGIIWLSPLQPLWKLTGIGMHTTALVQLPTSVHPLVHLAPISGHSTRIMPRPRGRPRRGSPWKPRRPSVSPPASPSSHSSPSIHPEPIPPAPPDIVVSNFDSLAIIPKMLSSSSRLPPNPPGFEPPPPPHQNSAGTTGGEPPPCENQPLNSFLDNQLRDSLGILYSLVFELRQGVEDLQFRLLAVDEKVAVLLQLLNSLQEALPTDIAGVASAKEPVVQPTRGTPRRSVRLGMSRTKLCTRIWQRKWSQHMARCRTPRQLSTETGGSMDTGKRWDDGVTYVEEEPWSEAVHVTWPGHLPNV